MTNNRNIEKINTEKIIIDGSKMALQRFRHIEIHENGEIKKYILRRTSKGKYLMN